ncbi:MAG: hypothetical protein WCG75_00505 [Armatimonadota bacterium]
MKQNEINFWTKVPFSNDLWMMVILTVLVGALIVFGLSKAPSQARRPIIWILTFLSGAFFVLYQYWPKSINFDKNTQLPNGGVEKVADFLNNSNSIVGTIAQVLAAFMLGLGIFSILKIHGTKIAKRQKDWAFSVVLIVSLLLMVFLGYGDFHIREATKTVDFDNPEKWGAINMGRDFLFEGLLQQMDAAMFSIIAFFILSAAYRAFRARSVEATILLGTALLVIFSLMGGIAYLWDTRLIDEHFAKPGVTHDLIQNLKLAEISKWIRGTFQTPAITGIKFGIGLGTLSMAVRIWLGLEKGGK